jgi:transposase
MQSEHQYIKRYSTAFKQKVIEEIESGKLTKSGARRLYGIGGETTIQKWIKQFGKLHLLNKIIRIELKDEVSKLKQLEKEKKELESALAQAHLKLVTYESIIEVAEEELGRDFKKNLKSELSIKADKKAKALKQKRK